MDRVVFTDEFDVLASFISQEKLMKKHGGTKEDYPNFHWLGN
jgi:hypothetical protein